MSSGNRNFFGAEKREHLGANAGDALTEDVRNDRVAAIKPCVCKPVGFPDADVTAIENKSAPILRPIAYWRLWLFDTALVSAGILFFLATQYGTYEFFGKACAMALLPLIPVMILLGGAGSTVFALTKVWIEKRSLLRPAAQAVLVGPALVLTLGLVLLGAFKSPAHRLAYICLGNPPASASQVRIAGYSTFLRKEWLAVFNVDEKAFRMMVDQAKLTPADGFELRKMLESSALQRTGLYQSLSPPTAALCFKRVFKEGEEHELGSVYAAFDPATSTAIVLRGYHD